MPKVEVIIPAYNAAKYLSIALESVIAQTFHDWRIILVDDGSKDATPEVAAAYQKKLGDRLVYIRQTNAGPSAARNLAIRHSTAEFLALLDADDIWPPNRLHDSLQSFEGRPSVGLTYGFNTRIGPDGSIIDTFDSRQPHGEGWIAPYLYMRLVDLPCPTITFRRECVDRVGFFDETLRASEDRDLWLRISLQYEVALVPHLLGHYRTSPESATTDSDLMLNAQLRFIQKHYGVKGCGWIARRRALAGIYRQRAETFANRQQLWKALKSSLRAVAYYPPDKRTLRTALSVLLISMGLRRRRR